MKSHEDLEWEDFEDSFQEIDEDSEFHKAMLCFESIAEDLKAELAAAEESLVHLQEDKAMPVWETNLEPYHLFDMPDLPDDTEEKLATEQLRIFATFEEGFHQGLDSYFEASTVKSKEEPNNPDLKFVHQDIKFDHQDLNLVNRLSWLDTGQPLRIFKSLCHNFVQEHLPFRCAPALGQMTRRHQQEFPEEASWSTIGAMFVDNFASDIPGEAVMVKDQAIALLKEKLNMHLRKWLSNCEDVLAIPPGEVARSIQLEGLDLATSSQLAPVTRTLGMVYIARDNVFTYDYNLTMPTVGTRRMLLGRLSKFLWSNGICQPIHNFRQDHVSRAVSEVS